MARRSLLQKIPTECGVSECELETSTMKRHWSENIWCPRKKKLSLGSSQFFFMWVNYYREIRHLLIFFSLSKQKPEFCVHLSYKQFLLKPFLIILPFKVA